MLRSPRLFCIASCAAVSLAALLASCGEGPSAREGANGEGAPPPMPEHAFSVTAVAVRGTPVTEAVELVGDVRASRRTELGFERAGRISTFHVDTGDRVAAEQVLAELGRAELVEQLAAVNARAAASLEEAEQAERDAKRAREVGADIVQAAERERLASRALTAKLRADQDAAEVRRLQVEDRRCELAAPYAGVIRRRILSEGAHVQVGEAVFELVDPARREIELEVPPHHAARLATGAAVELRCDELPGFRLTHRLHTLIPAADPGTRSFTGLVRLDGDHDAELALLPGMFVRARVTLRRATGQGTVPVDALVRTERGTHVVLAEGEEDVRARLLPVRVLARADGLAAVESLDADPVPANARVVVAGAENLFPGAKLRLVELPGGSEAASREP